MLCYKPRPCCCGAVSEDLLFETWTSADPHYLPVNLSLLLLLFSPLIPPPNSPKTFRDKRQIEDREGWGPVPMFSHLSFSLVSTLRGQVLQALKSSKSTHCRIHCHLAELGHSSALGGQIFPLLSLFHRLPIWRKCYLAWHCRGHSLCIDELFPVSPSKSSFFASSVIH